jgi:translocation and assembly module TamB
VNLVKQTMDLKVIQARSPLRYLSLLKIAPIEDLNLDIDVADVHVTGSFTAPIYTGRANVSGSFKEQNFTASSVLRGDTKGITFKQFELFADSGRIAAQGLINWSREKLDLQIQAEDVPLAMLKLLEITIPDEIDLLISVKGGLKGSFQIPRFAGIASASGSYQDQSGRTAINMSASLGADPKKVTVHESHATLAFTADSPTHPQQSKNQQTTSVKAKGDFFPESQRIDVSMNFEALPLNIYQLFGLNIPYQAAGYFAGDLHISGLLSEPTIAGELIGSGSFENSPFSVEIEGAGSRDNFIVKAAKASWGEARCSGKGQYQEGIADFSVSLNEFNLENLTVFGIETIPVELNLDFAVKGSFDNPSLRGKVRLTHWVADQNNPDKSFRLDWNSDVVLEREVLTVHSALLSNEIAQGNIELAFPWYDYLHRLQQASNFVRADMPVTASARGWLDLDWIEYFIDQDDHQFGGMIDIDLITSGVLGDPNVTGVVGLKSGVYKNQVSRTSIEKGEMEILFAGRRLDVATGKASDGDGGRILVQGFIDWSHNALTGQLGDVAIDITTKSIQLVRRDELEGEASGKLTVTGDFHRLLVNGEVEVSPLRVVLDLLNDSSIPELELVALEDTTTETAEDVIFSMPEINLNVVMKASRKAFVSGRGLNAELEGMVRIVGSLDNTDYRGRFAIVRGTFDLFGKRFNLEEGDMLFENDTISIYVEGRHSDSEYEYLVTISGGLNDLKIELSTVPDLPQDEAISRLLFGKSVRGITPFQAVRLAQAVQELRGKSSGFDPISTTRNILQLDNLTVDSAKTDNGSGEVG